jgi:hypothetical protein
MPPKQGDNVTKLANLKVSTTDYMSNSQIIKRRQDNTHRGKEQDT